MTLEQAQLPFVFRLLFNHVHIPVDRSLAETRFKRKLVDGLVEIVAHIAAHCVGRHPGWAGYMVARELLPDTFGDIEPQGLRDPFQFYLRS
ncbi:hypothetical protein SAMN05720761_1092 [Fibrobacter sp. UWCM]|nr:hypothetical protein [Fibrobacter sp. UWCM]SHH11124.1 hypothetical protein SAMN05720761_1092 [Fibrobacter sp. UWCM]